MAVQLKSAAEIAKLREANLIVAECEGSPFCALVDQGVIVASVGDDRSLTYGDAAAHATDECAIELAVA